MSRNVRLQGFIFKGTLVDQSCRKILSLELMDEILSDISLQRAAGPDV